MGEVQLFAWVMIFGLLDSSCDAQKGYPPSNFNEHVFTERQPVVPVSRPTVSPWFTRALVTAHPTFGEPEFTHVPMTAHPTFGGAGYTQVPVSPRPTFGGAGYTQVPVRPRPTFGGAGYTQAPVRPRPTFGGAGYTQAPVSPRPTFGGAGYTQAPVSPRPTFGGAGYTQAPVSPRPTFGGAGYTQAPVSPRPTFGGAGYTQAPVSPRPTFGGAGYTQAPVSPRPTFGGPKLPTTAVEYPTSKPDAVKVYCGESSVQLDVDMDFLGNNHLIQPSDITLGGCGPVGQDVSARVLFFATELHGCNSVLMMTEDSLVYTFGLDYQPKALGSTPIIRTNGAIVGVQCHYIRLHNVSSNALKPTWIPYRSTLSAEDLLVFSLRLMDDNWQMERTSNVFFLGDLINIEASVVQANHVPLHVFVDSCVATLDPNMNAVPRYAFVENQGCLMDSKLTNSRSQFLSRVQNDKLQFQLDAFRFAKETRSAIYFFCHLKATALSPEGKACSFSLGTQRWISASGNHEVCSCCDASCTGRKGRSLTDSATQYEGDSALGPIVIQQASASGLVPAAQSQHLVVEDHRAGGVSEAVVMTGLVAALGLICTLVLVTVLLRRLRKPNSVNYD
ncbi:zona pellucida sperm-binding protein 3-like isoform X2 [Anguilla rostrata]|uniref:zona pellucida sperm-binding protein 3-like isoform X2 n=1 Tax=Anguilla rostrata TaxID=7938 RepID=UPI0030CE6B65